MCPVRFQSSEIGDSNCFFQPNGCFLGGTNPRVFYSDILHAVILVVEFLTFESIWNLCWDIVCEDYYVIT